MQASRSALTRAEQIPGGPLRRAWRLYTEAPFARLLLLALGFWRIPVDFANPRVLRLRCVRGGLNRGAACRGHPVRLGLAGGGLG